MNINLATKVLDNKMPHEVLLGKTTSYKHLKLFGCLTYASDSLGKIDKVVERVRPCVFLGYLMGQKGCKVYDLKNEKIVVSRNVTFVEMFFLLESIM